MPHPAALASRSISPAVIDATIDRYATAQCARLDRLFARAALSEPVIKDADRAVKSIEPLLETLIGLALGRVIGGVMQGVRRTFEPAVSRRMAEAMAHALRTLGPPGVTPLFALDASPCRAFGAEVKQRLRRRMATAVPGVREVLSAMAGTLAPHEEAAFVRMLGLLADDPLLADRFEPQIGIAWCCYVAVVENATCDPADAQWVRWLKKVRGVKEVIETAGIVTRIG